MRVLNNALREETTLLNAVHIGPRFTRNTAAAVNGSFARVIGERPIGDRPAFCEQMGEMTN